MRLKILLLIFALEYNFAHLQQECVFLPSDMKPTVRLTQNPDYKVMYPGEQVSFSCHINVSSGWEYEWYKDGIKRSESESTLSLDLSEATDSGSYSCRAKRGSRPDFITDSTPSIRLDVKGELLLT